MSITDLLAASLIAAGFYFLAATAAGAVRFPDFYTRCHALGVTDTVGSLLLLSGIALHHGVSFVSAKILAIIIFIYVANPTVTHVLVRAALKRGLKPWSRAHG